MIRFEHVCKYYSAKTSNLEKDISALVDINIDVAKGEFLVLSGPNGGGKTTLLKLISCQEIPSAGKVFFDGQELGKIKKKKIPYLRRRMGIIFQNFKLLYKRTVFENVSFVLAALNLPEEIIFDKVCAVLKTVDLIRKKDMFPYQLSHGERQKLCIARSLVNDPEIILADEPLANLDIETQEEIMRVFHAANEKGVTIILASNNQKFDTDSSYRVLTLIGGKVKEK